MKKYIVLFVLGIVLSNVGQVSAETAMDAACDDLKTNEKMMTCIAYLNQTIATLTAQKKVSNSMDVIDPTLKKGDSGESVNRLQETLARDAATYPAGLVTGFFGQLTEAAISSFQVRHGLTATGLLDEKTHYLLERYYCAMNPKTTGCGKYETKLGAAKTYEAQGNDRGSTFGTEMGSLATKGISATAETGSFSWGGFLSGFGISGLVDAVFGGTKSQAEIDATPVVDAVAISVSSNTSQKDALDAFIDLNDGFASWGGPGVTVDTGTGNFGGLGSAAAQAEADAAAAEAAGINGLDGIDTDSGAGINGLDGIGDVSGADGINGLDGISGDSGDGGINGFD